MLGIMHALRMSGEKFRALVLYLSACIAPIASPSCPTYMPFGGKLDPDNRWVKLARIVPWHLVEEDYRANFADSGMGAPAKESSIALGALIIKECLGVTDEAGCE